VILILSTILCVLLKNAVAFMGDLVGILPANCVCVVFPCLAFLKLNGGNMGRWPKLGVLSLAVLFGLYSSLQSRVRRSRTPSPTAAGGSPLPIGTWKSRPVGYHSSVQGSVYVGVFRARWSLGISFPKAFLWSLNG
ncbi:unnamed protein product, partial [Durusdinium trenchii]